MKGALAAPLLLVGAAAAAWGSAQTSPGIWAVSLACIGVLLWCQRESRWTFTPLALAIWAYAGWTILHTSVISRAYSPAGLFDPLFLAGGFAVARGLDRDQRLQCYRALGLLAALLAIWAAGQAAFGSSRGHAHLETSNTLASVLNLALAPALVAVASGTLNRQLHILSAVLFVGLCATLSRGGAIALVGSLAITLAIGRTQNIARSGLLLLGGASVAALIVAASTGWSRDSVSSRFELYRLAWATAGFGWGIGYLAFRHLLEVGRAEVPSYGESSFTYFVHNDYLQTLLELGVPGLVALLAIAFLALRAATAVSRSSRSNGEPRAESSAILASVLTMLIHALVDFPFHVPLCLLLFGFAVGVLDRLDHKSVHVAAPGPVQRLATFALAVALVVLLVRPVIAEAAAAYGIKKWLLGEPEAAAVGFEWARRADPRDWRYHLYAGQFWFAQAAENGRAEEARLADDAFAAGMAANALEPSAALARAFTQLRYGSVLAMPVPPILIRAWAEQALLVAPLNPAVRREYEEIIRRLPGNYCGAASPPMRSRR